MVRPGVWPERFDRPAFVVIHGEDNEYQRYGESYSGPLITPQWPLVFDLIDDPVEQWDLMEKRLDCGWVFAPVATCIGALQQSFTQ